MTETKKRVPKKVVQEAPVTETQVRTLSEPVEEEKEITLKYAPGEAFLRRQYRFPNLDKGTYSVYVQEPDGSFTLKFSGDRYDCFNVARKINSESRIFRYPVVE